MVMLVVVIIKLLVEDQMDVGNVVQGSWVCMSVSCRVYYTNVFVFINLVRFI